MGLTRQSAARDRRRWPARLLLVAIAVPGSDVLKFVTGSLQLIALVWLGLRLALLGAPGPPPENTTWCPVLAALSLTAFDIPAAPLAVVRAIILVLVILLLTVPELRQARLPVRATTTA